MSLKSFSFGLLTGGVLATLVLVIAPISFSALYFIESTSAQTTSDRKAEADRLLEKGNQLYKISQYRGAIQVWEQALTIYREIKDRNGEATSLDNLGLAYNNLGDYKKAVSFYQQSLAIVRAIKDRRSEGIALSNIGSTYNSLKQYEKAIDFYQQSLAIAREIKDRRSEGIALSNLGFAYNSLGKYQKSIEHHQQSIDIYKQISDKNGEGQSLNSLGNVYEAIGQYQKAISYYQQSLVIKRQIGDKNGEANSLNNLGNVYNSIENYPQAIQYFEQALPIFRKIRNTIGEAASINNLGNAYTAIGQYQDAIKYYQASLSIVRRNGDSTQEGKLLNNLGNAYTAIDQFQKAIDYFQKSLSIKKRIGDLAGEGKSFSNLGELLVKLKQSELAILFYKQSVNVRESIRKDIKGLSKEEQKSYLATIEKDYRDLADLLLKQDRILEAQQILDLLKVQELSDYFRSADVGDSAKKADYQPPEQNIIALGNELAKLQDTNPRTKEQEQRLAYLTNRESSLSEQFNAFLQSAAVQEQIKQLKLANAKNVDIEEYNQLSVSLKEIKNAVVLYPLILDDRLELILITANTPPIRKTTNIKREALNKDISDFLSNLRDPSSVDVQADAKKFYNYLIKPFEAELKEANIETIIYSPDGQLRYIPLAALHDGKQWLIEKYRINNITSASLTNLRPRTYKSPLVLAAAATNSQNIKIGDQSIAFGALPATKTEVEAIAALLPNTTTFIDQQFNKADTIPKMQSNTIIHLATHGYFAIGKPEDSFIIFGDGDKATIADMKKWTLTKVELVVLSACETAIGGKLGNGIEILGLGYQIQNRGAGAAIASLWKVSDNGTSELMQALYKNLSQKNISSSEALRQAQITMIRSNKKGNSSDRGTGIKIVGTVPNNEETQLSHPFYWSAFILIGNGL